MAAQVPPAPGLSELPAWALKSVPGLEHGGPALRIERLGGGTVNVVYRVDSAQGRFVVRLNGPAWRRPGVERTRELRLHRAAAAGAIAPTIVAAAPATQGLMITEFHDGRCWNAGDYADVGALRRLGERLYALHRLAAPDIEPFKPRQIARDYQRLITPQLAAALDPAMRRLDRLCERSEQADATLRIVHGDLWEGNVLEGTGLWLLDWEYAQLADPLMDLACLLAYYPHAQPHRDELMAAAGFDAKVYGKVLTERVDIYRILSWLWHLARGEAAEPPALNALEDW
jgi:aminoglycoside phosphotransferase (APT) family kinase protein